MCILHNYRIILLSLLVWKIEITWDSVLLSYDFGDKEYKALFFKICSE